MTEIGSWGNGVSYFLAHVLACTTYYHQPLPPQGLGCVGDCVGCCGWAVGALEEEVAHLFRLSLWQQGKPTVAA